MQRFELCEEAEGDYLVELELNKQNNPKHLDPHRALLEKLSGTDRKLVLVSLCSSNMF
jgi:hypothetical protein